MSGFQQRLQHLVAPLGFVGASRFSAAVFLRRGGVHGPIPTANRVLNLVASTVLVGVAVELLVEARLGLTPFDALAFGVGDRIGLTLGQSGWLLAGLLYGLAGLLGRRPSPWSVAYIGLCGLTIDGTAGLLAPTDALTTRVVFLLCGIGLMASAVGVIVNSDVGGGPVELLLLAGRDRGLSMGTGKVIFDAGFLIGAVAVGGPVAVGTLVYGALMGPTIQAVSQALIDHRAGREHRRTRRSDVASPV